MKYRPVLVTAPAEDPVTLEEVKAHLRVIERDENGAALPNEDDALITALIKAAVTHLDGWTGVLGRCLVDQTWRLVYDAFTQCMRLPIGPVSAIVSVKWRNADGQLATVAAELGQEGTTRISALATYGDLRAMPSTVDTTADEPTLPPIEECVPGSLAPVETRRMAPIMDRFDMRFDAACIGWAMGAPSGAGHIQAWFRLADGHDVDPLGLLMVCDALPPVTFDLGRPGWAPTLELTVHVRAVPAPGWLKVSHRTRNVAGGMFEEDCEVWDSAGRLVAQSRQLAMQPRA